MTFLPFNTENEAATANITFTQNSLGLYGLFGYQVATEPDRVFPNRASDQNSIPDHFLLVLGFT